MILQATIRSSQSMESIAQQLLYPICVVRRILYHKFLPTAAAFEESIVKAFWRMITDFHALHPVWKFPISSSLPGGSQNTLFIITKRSASRQTCFLAIQTQLLRGNIQGIVFCILECSVCMWMPGESFLDGVS